MSTSSTLLNRHQSPSYVSKDNFNEDGKPDDLISHVDGLLVALNFCDHMQLLQSTRTPDFRTRNLALGSSSLSKSRSEFSQVPGDVDDEAKDMIERYYSSSSRGLVNGIDWAFIDEIRARMDNEWKRLQTSVEVLNIPRLRTLSSFYANAEELRNAGVIAFREVVLGRTPTELETVVAMASVSYVISRMLWTRETLLESDILDGIGIWIKSITSQEERHFFNEIAQRLWPQCRKHLCIWSSESAGNDFGLLGNHSHTPISFNFPALSESNPITSPFGDASDFNPSSSAFTEQRWQAPDPQGPVAKDAPSSNLRYDDLGIYAGISADPLPTYTNPQAFGEVGSRSMLTGPPWFPSSYISALSPAQPTPKSLESLCELADDGRMEDQYNRPSYQVPQGIQNTKAFFILRAMFKYLGNSLTRLSGNGTTHREDCSASNEEDRVKGNLEEYLRRQVQNEVTPHGESLQAVQLVTAQFVGWNLIQTFAETRSFMTSIGRELILHKPTYTNFCNWIASIPVGTESEFLLQNDCIRRESASTASTSKTDGGDQGDFICNECGASFTERKNLVRHINTKPHPRKYKRRARIDVGESGDKRKQGL